MLVQASRLSLHRYPHVCGSVTRALALVVQARVLTSRSLPASWSRHCISSSSSSGSSNSSDTKKEFSDTLQLPQTDMPIRAGREEDYLAAIGVDTYRWVQTQAGDREPFLLHDGPPYANGNPHMGHLLNRTLKDTINRYQVSQGRSITYRPGWDCHGLPIELRAIKEMSKTEKKERTDISTRKKARQVAEASMAVQKAEFIRWGVMADWDNPYRTMDPAYEAGQLDVFARMFQEGLITRDRAPVYWSPSTRTALAEAELEYPEGHVSTSVYVAFPVAHPGSCQPLQRVLAADDGASSSSRSSTSKVAFAVWTTTPWTLPANTGLCVHPKLTYDIVAMNDDKNGAAGQYTHIIVASALRDQLSSLLSLPSTSTVVATVTGSDLAGLDEHGMRVRDPVTAARPLTQGEGPIDVPIVADGYVTADTGTGVVHSAPGHGQDDFRIGAMYGLAVLSPVGDDGKFTSEAGADLQGLAVLGEGNEAVIQQLQQRQLLLHQAPYPHKYPYDWRSKKPVIVRTTPQWFADVSALLEPATEALTHVSLLPAEQHQRLARTVRSRRSWCISRQRSWGVPLPVFYPKYSAEEGGSDDALLTPETIAHVRDLVAQHGSDCWWTMEVAELLPPSLRDHAEWYVKGRDTMDVWFDSGTSWRTVLPEIPADVYLEGGDQHRGWFQSSLLTAVAAEGRAPFRQIITHGFVLDQHGRKMSKSIGNVVEPAEVFAGKKYRFIQPGSGADALRYWAASSDYHMDVNIGETVVKQSDQAVRKVRNTARFILGNLADFDPARHAVYDVSQLTSIDRYAAHLTHSFLHDVRAGYDTSAFHRVTKALNNYVGRDLSSLYFEIVKDRLYADATDAPRRRAAQTMLHEGLRAIIQALAPIAPFTAQEIYQHLPQAKEGSSYPSPICDPQYSLAYPTPDIITPADPTLQSQWSTILGLRDTTYRLLDVTRKDKTITSSAGADVDIYPGDAALGQVLSEVTPSDLTDYLVAGNVTLHPPGSTVPDTTYQITGDVVLQGDAATAAGSATLPVTITIRPSAAAKCGRCWRSNGDAARDGSLCDRCHSVLSSQHKA